MGRKVAGVLCLFLGGELDRYLTQWGPWAEAYLDTKWHPNACNLYTNVTDRQGRQDRQTTVLLTIVTDRLVTERPTDRQRYSVCNNRLHLRT